ncbi:hypothetical protein Tco_0219269, partial [Tanacetum coccineum]
MVVGIFPDANFIFSASESLFQLCLVSAFVSGEKSGVILETPFKMSETLNGKNNLDIQGERNVIQDRHMLLVDNKANEATISAGMKKFGIQ